ncbi:MAG TPA: hypothetical protein VG817_01110 [Gemmatimonadales bacterium]|nr:hypothetical protein [Gemmatimonadales bacterium]
MRALLIPTLLTSLLLLPPAIEAQAPRYLALQLDRACFRVDAQASILTVAGKERSRESTGKHGILTVRGTAIPGDSALRLEAWFDSLSLFREGDGERLEPDTDGLIGGRFIALLSPSGFATTVDLPYFPDDVAQVGDLSTALTSLLPQLPAVPLSNGAGWRDDLGTVITRLGDITLGAQRLQRYRLSRKSTRPVQQLLPDSSVVTANRTESEDGTFFWSAERGVVRWERDLNDELTVEKGGVVKQPFRTAVEQRVTVERLAGACASP